MRFALVHGGLLVRAIAIAPQGPLRPGPVTRAA